MAAGVGALGVDRPGRRPPRCRRDSPRRRVERIAPAPVSKTACVQIVGSQRRPERRARPHPFEGCDQPRVEPGSGAVADLAPRGLDAVRPCGTRRRPAPAARCGHRPGSRRPQARPACRRRPSARRGSGCRAATVSEKRICRAMSAPRWQRVSISSRAISPPFWKMLRMARKRSDKPGLHARVRQHEAQRLRQAAVDGLEVALEGEIVGQIELADARRIAAAAEILQQQHVVEVRKFRIAQADGSRRYGSRSSSSGRNGRPAGPR